MVVCTNIDTALPRSYVHLLSPVNSIQGVTMFTGE